jgi:electron transfer flavoprotein alpha subunit
MKIDNNFALQLHPEDCISCEACVSACSYGSITFTDLPTIDISSCRLCGSCVTACPTEALVMSDNAPIQDDKTNGVWVLAEVEGEEIATVTLELLGKATELAQTLNQKVEVVLIGTQTTALAQQLIEQGADRVHAMNHPIFEKGIEEHQVQVVEHLVKQYNPNILLVGATENGRGISARLAGVLKTGLTADCTALAIDTEEQSLLQCRPAFGGNLMATIKTPTHRPQMASVRPGVMKALSADNKRTGEVITHNLSSFDFDNRITLLSQSINTIKEAKLNNSRIIIALGRGVKETKTIEEIHRLANKLGAVVAGSRAAVELGIVDVSLQIGQTGHTVAPDLYIAIGISGQIQHVAAITGSKQIIAINSDASAPIFNYADYGWVGSIETLMPQLLNSLT